MRIVTLGTLAGIGTGYLYQGNGYLIRFEIPSAEQFFATQLPFLVSTLKIDVRQIMSLELMSCQYSGLESGVLCISFEDADPADTSNLPETLIENLSDAPSIPVSDDGGSDDQLRRRFLEFLRFAPKRVKRGLRQHLSDANKVRRRRVPRPESMAGLSYRVSFDGGPPSLEEWRNALLYCSESLRRNFSPERIERIRFTPIARSEGDYKVEVELLLPRTVQVFQDRSHLRFRPLPRFRALPGKPIHFTATALNTALPEANLSVEEKAVLEKFDQLDTHGRLRFWHQHLAKFFK